MADPQLQRFLLRDSLILVLTLLTLGMALGGQLQRVMRRRDCFSIQIIWAWLEVEGCLLASTVEQLMKLIFKEELQMKY